MSPRHALTDFHVLRAASRAMSSGSKFRTIDELGEDFQNVSVDKLLDSIRRCQMRGFLDDGNPRWAYLTKLGEAELSRLTFEATTPAAKTPE
jgi:hypothetical protein